MTCRDTIGRTAITCVCHARTLAEMEYFCLAPWAFVSVTSQVISPIFLCFRGSTSNLQLDSESCSTFWSCCENRICNESTGKENRSATSAIKISRSVRALDSTATEAGCVAGITGAAAIGSLDACSVRLTTHRNAPEKSIAARFTPAPSNIAFTSSRSIASDVFPVANRPTIKSPVCSITSPAASGQCAI